MGDSDHLVEIIYTRLQQITGHVSHMLSFEEMIRIRHAKLMMRLSTASSFKWQLSTLPWEPISRLHKRVSYYIWAHLVFGEWSNVSVWTKTLWGKMIRGHPWKDDHTYWVHYEWIYVEYIMFQGSGSNGADNGMGKELRTLLDEMKGLIKGQQKHKHRHKRYVSIPGTSFYIMVLDETYGCPILYGLVDKDLQ